MQTRSNKRSDVNSSEDKAIEVPAEDTDDRPLKERLKAECDSQKITGSLAERAVVAFEADGYSSIIKTLQRDAVEDIISTNIKRGLVIELLDRFKLPIKSKTTESRGRINWRASAKLPVFSDGQEPGPYWTEFFQRAKASGVPDEEMPDALLFANLENKSPDVKKFLHDEIIAKKLDTESARQAFQSFFEKRSKEDLHEKIFFCIYGLHEKMEDYITRFHELTQKAGIENEDQLACATFKCRLPTEVRKTFEILQSARKLEGGKKDLLTYYELARAAASTQKDARSAFSLSNTQKRAFGAKSGPERAETENKLEKPSENPKSKIDLTKITCHRCKKIGHFANKCSVPTADLPKKSVTNAVAHVENNLVTIPLLINDHQLRGLVDSGCDMSIISSDWMEKLNLQPRETQITVKLANQETLAVKQEVDVMITSPARVNHTFLVTPIRFDCIVGVDLFAKLGIQLHLAHAATTDDNAPEPFDEGQTPLEVQDETLKQLIETQLSENLSRNKLIPADSYCTHPQAVIPINTITEEPIQQRPYPVPARLREKLEDVLRD
jgi:hypothetical protein